MWIIFYYIDMKTLIDYIVEKKETIQSLPFDSDFFEEFIVVFFDV